MNWVSRTIGIFWLHTLPVLMLVSACAPDSSRGNKETLFTLMPEALTHAGFINHLDYDKQLKKKFNIYTYRNFYNGGGVAIGDVNKDGLMDLFLTSNMGPNVLYLNRGDFEFEDISTQAGIEGHGEWSTGVSLADINGDGWTDIAVLSATLDDPGSAVPTSNVYLDHKQSWVALDDKLKKFATFP